MSLVLIYSCCGIFIGPLNLVISVKPTEILSRLHELSSLFFTFGTENKDTGNKTAFTVEKVFTKKRVTGSLILVTWKRSLTSPFGFESYWSMNVCIASITEKELSRTGGILLVMYCSSQWINDNITTYHMPRLLRTWNVSQAFLVGHKLSLKSIISDVPSYELIAVFPTGSEDPQVLAVTSAEESKRQSYIHELINTEETYMQDMSIVLEVSSRCF